MWRIAFLLGCLALLNLVFAQPAPAPLIPSYRPAVGQTFAYRLLLNGEVRMETASIVGFAHFAATVDIEQRWRQESNNRLRCEVTVKGGSLRVFSSVGEQQQKLGWVQLAFITTPNGEIVDVVGGGARSLEELVANFDLMATALATLIVPFPKEGIKIGDAWQGAHQLGHTITLTTVQCVEQPTTLPARLQPLKLRLRYFLPLDTLVAPMLRAQWNFTARYGAESEVLFSAAEGRTLSASGTIKLEVSGQVPTLSATPPQEPQPQQPPSPEQGHRNSEESSEQSPTQPSPSPPTTPTVAPTFKLLVDARFDLVPSR